MRAAVPSTLNSCHAPRFSPHLAAMTRGQQKIQAQQKNQSKQQKAKKSGSAKEAKASAQAALVFTCSVCRAQIPDIKTYRQHFESKHPKAPMPPKLKEA